MKVERYTLHNKAYLVSSGVSYFKELTSLIASAKQELHLQVYIFEPDETGNQIKNELILAAQRGVQVFLMVDGFGSASLPDKFIRDMKSAGIHFRFFGPLFSEMRFHIGRRMHHKVAVADTHTSLVGGINIGNRYNETAGQPPWFDFAVKAEGEIAGHLHAFCVKKWKGFRPGNRQAGLVKMHSPEREKAGPVCRIRIRINDRLRRRARIVYSYRDAIRHAKKEVVILGAYFIPGKKFISLMNMASRKGVIIRVITGSRSDVWLAQNAMHWLYRRLMRNNIEIYEYAKAPVHGKVLLVDGHFVSIGSYDLNQLSSFINLELNLDIADESFASEVREVFEKTIRQDCIPITPPLLEKRETLPVRFRQWLAYRLLRIMFFITLFVSSKKDY